LVGDVYNVSRLVGLVKDIFCPVVDLGYAVRVRNIRENGRQTKTRKREISVMLGCSFIGSPIIL
jgi:hypothetical protein